MRTSHGNRLALIGGTFAILMNIAGVAFAEGDVKKGRKIAITHCARCHVVGDYNPYGGIGSTPSFRSMASSPDIFMERFETFYLRNPHPVFVLVEGVRTEFKLPPYAAPFTIKLDDIADIIAFVKTLRK